MPLAMSQASSRVLFIVSSQCSQMRKLRHREARDGITGDSKWQSQDLNSRVCILGL